MYSHTGGSRTWSASSAGDLSSVKEDHQEAETESVKHKELTQWGGVEKEPVSSPGMLCRVIMIITTVV